MTRVRIAPVLCAAIVAVAVLAAGSTAADTKLYAFMDGKSEVPKKGDADGHARITLTLRPSSKQVCYDIRLTKLQTPQAAHVHRGRKGEAGPVFIALFASPRGAGKGKITGCARNVPASKINALKARPAGYYANIHTKSYPDGAVRGQLSTTRP
jgi:hypothetical protein